MEPPHEGAADAAAGASAPVVPSIAAPPQQQQQQQQQQANPTLRVSHEGEHHGDFGNVEVSITQSTYRYVFCAAVNSCNLGYDIGVSTSAGKLVQDHFDLSDFEREIFVASINFWAMFGALAAQHFTDRFGRRRTFVVAAIGFIIGVVIQAIAWSYALLLIGRFFVGLGVGVGLAIDPLYIAEVTSAKHRGELVTWSEIALNIGIVMGFAMGLILAPAKDSTEWRLMFLFGAIMPSLMIFLVVTIMPESPRWLVSQNRDAEAKMVLQTIYPPGFAVDPIVEDIREALKREEMAEQSVGWGVITNPTAAIRRMLLVGIGTAIAQQLVGIDAIQYYLLDILEEAGIESETRQNVVLVLLGLLKLVFIIVGGKLFDRRGRRPLFFVSCIGMSAALFMVSMGFYANDESTGFTVFGIALYLSFFSIGMGPGAWLIPSEIFSICIRAKAMSIATFLNRATATLMSATFLTSGKALEFSGLFLLLSVVCLIVFGFFYALLPETKGRSLEDMSIYFAELTGDRSLLEAEAKLQREAAGNRSGDQEMSSIRPAADVGAESQVI